MFKSIQRAARRGHIVLVQEENRNLPNSHAQYGLFRLHKRTKRLVREGKIRMDYTNASKLFSIIVNMSK